MLPQAVPLNKSFSIQNDWTHTINGSVGGDFRLMRHRGACL